MFPPLNRKLYTLPLVIVFSLFFPLLLSNAQEVTTVLASNSSAPLTGLRKHRAEQLINLFENGSTESHYDYVESLHDGRGITAGKVGFTTANADLLVVVAEYARRKPKNSLVKFLPRLRELAEEESDSTKGLNGFTKAWKVAARDAVFRKVQDDVTDRIYYQPAMRHARKLGLQTALAQAAIYDTIIQHGDGEDPDSLSAILGRTNQAVGGTPARGVDEEIWLENFLKMRREDLAHAYDENTRAEWSQSVGRCDVFMMLAEQRNYNLSGVIMVDAGGFHDVLQD
jgi:chitosanase